MIWGERGGQGNNEKKQNNLSWYAARADAAVA